MNELGELTDDEVFEGLNNFAIKLFGEQQQLPPEFQEILDKNMWELCDDR
jgi:hypothetical protein